MKEFDKIFEVIKGIFVVLGSTFGLIFLFYALHLNRNEGNEIEAIWHLLSAVMLGILTLNLRK